MNDTREPSSWIGTGFRAVEFVLVVILAMMVVMAFGNVVLRYGFASGITVSEEVSRLLFVWLTFLGAIPVMWQQGHLGVEFVVGTLPPAGRRICRIVSDLLMLGCCVVFGWGWGAWGQTQLNLTNYAPVSGLPTAWAYGAAALSALGLGLLIIADLMQTLRTPAAVLPPLARGYEP